MPTNLNDVLDERERRYGSFEKHAEISQALKTVVFSQQKQMFQTDQIEALEMICHKIARIVNGDADYIDSWTDIAGYAQLVATRLERDNFRLTNGLTKENCND